MEPISETCGAGVGQRYECCQCPGVTVFVNFYFFAIPFKSVSLGKYNLPEDQTPRTRMIGK
jgi:hypothetical protein